MPPKKQQAQQEAAALVKAFERMLAAGASSSAQSASGGTKKKKRKASKKKGGSGTSQIRFSRTELVASAVIPAGKTTVEGSVFVVPKSLPILGKMAAAFERVRWERVQFYWKPMVSAMYSGSIALGVDWDNSAPKTKRSDIAAYAPSRVLPLREDMESRPLVIPPDRLRARQWWAFSDDQANIAGPCTLCWAVEGEKAGSVGEIYMTYTAVLDGPHA